VLDEAKLKHESCAPLKEGCSFGLAYRRCHCHCRRRRRRPASFPPSATATSPPSVTSRENQFWKQPRQRKGKLIGAYGDRVASQTYGRRTRRRFLRSSIARHHLVQQPVVRSKIRGKAEAAINNLILPLIRVLQEQSTRITTGRPHSQETGQRNLSFLLVSSHQRTAKIHLPPVSEFE
jgi:hypothetical protein